MFTYGDDAVRPWRGNVRSSAITGGGGDDGGDDGESGADSDDDEVEGECIGVGDRVFAPFENNRGEMECWGGVVVEHDSAQNPPLAPRRRPRPPPSQKKDRP